MSAIQEALERARRERESSRTESGGELPGPPVLAPPPGRARGWLGRGALAVLMTGAMTGLILSQLPWGSSWLHALGIPGLSQRAKEALGLQSQRSAPMGMAEKVRVDSGHEQVLGSKMGVSAAVPQETAGPELNLTRELLKARAMRQRGEIHGAEKLLSALVERQPHAAEALVALADLYMRDLKEPKRAIPLYQRAIQQSPARASLRINLGVAYMRAGETVKAVEQLLGAVDLDPNMAEAHYNLACGLALQGKRAEAERALERAVSLDPRARQWAEQDPDLALLRRAPMQASGRP